MRKWPLRKTKEEELKGDRWESLKRTIEAMESNANAVSTNCTLAAHFRWYMSGTARYKKVDDRDCLFNTFNYDLLIFKMGSSSMAHLDRRDK